MKCVQRCETLPWKMRTSLNLTIFFFTINQIFFSVVFVVVISDLVFVSFSALEFCNCSLSWLPMTPSCMFLPLSIYYVYLSLSLKRQVTEFFSSVSGVETNISNVIILNRHFISVFLLHYTDMRLSFRNLANNFFSNSS